MEFIKIGKNEWCTEDARFTRDRNGEAIHMAKSIEEWDSYCLNDEYCCCAYDFDDKNIKKYGLFYNVHCINQSDSIVPEGYKLPSYDDWCDLITSLGSNLPKDKYSQSEVLIKLKSQKGWPGKIAFTNPLTGSNESGFTALPGGYLEHVMMPTIFHGKGQSVHWWTSDYATVCVSEYDKGIFTLKTAKNTDRYFDLKHSAFKEGKYMRLIKL